MSIEETKASIKLHKTKTPSTGDLVFYVGGTKEEDGKISGEARPAIIVRVWETPENPATRDSHVQLQVFTDGMNDGLDNVVWRTSIHQDHEKGPRTFHYKIS